jgi:TPR repeat protein
MQPPDLDAARHWYERAADAGNSDAMKDLGYLYAWLMEPPDLDAACHWYERAADVGNPKPCASWYLYAERMQPPISRPPVTGMKRAADAGNSTAMYNLAVMYKHRMKPRDMKTARRWLDRAAEAGLDLDLVCAESFTRRAALRVYRAGTALLRWGESGGRRSTREWGDEAARHAAGFADAVEIGVIDPSRRLLRPEVGWLQVDLLPRFR